MTEKLDTDPPGEAEALTAYLDGELAEPARSELETRLRQDQALAARLEMLRAGGRDFPAAFDVLATAAPAARLQTILAEVQARSRATAARRNSRRLMAIAAALVLFVAGGAIGVFLPRVVPALQPAPVWNWRATVAEYVSLYTTETFAGIPDDMAVQSRQLAAIGGKLGLSLDPERVALPGLALKGAIIFSYRDKPLAQVAYLSAENGPVALCIYNNGRAEDAPPKFEQRDGMNIVFWQKGGRGYLVIGRTPKADLEKFATELGQRI